MIKMIAAVARKPGMTRSEFFAYIQHVHGRITTDNPLTIRKYVQNHVEDSAFGTTAERTHSLLPVRDSVTELSFDDAGAMQDTFSDEYVKTVVGPDGQNFSDEKNSLSVVVKDVEQDVLQPASGCGGKVMHFLRAADGLDLETFFARWKAAHLEALASCPEAAATVRRCVHHHQLPEFNDMLAYFGGLDVPAYEGVASLWYDNMSCTGMFRAYEKALLEINSDPEKTFYCPEQSFFMYAREITVYEDY
ncbi:EthD domain-containing protein [Vibrio aerogenes]|uniref:EthD domain-containing protein n=1 Tax=Vibrio aerogenes TaxID=92172 RepID=UPI0039EE9617